MQHLQQPFFRKVFLSYTILLVFSFLLILTPVSLQTYRRDQRQLEREHAEKVQLLARALDDAAFDMEQIAQRLSGTSWVKKVSSNSEILYEQVDYLTRRDICSEMSRYHGLTRSARSVALLLPQKDMAIDRTSFWETDRYFSSIGVKATDFWQDLLAEAADAPRSLQLYATESCSYGFFVFRRLDYGSSPKQILLFAVDAGELSNALSRNFSDEICFFQINCQQEPIVTIGAEQDGKDLFRYSCSSEIYPWSYTFQIRFAYVRPNSGYLLVLLTGLLAFTAGILLAFLLTNITSRPLYDLIRRIGTQPDRDSSEFAVIEHAFHSLSSEKDTLEQSSREHFRRIRESLLRALLNGVFDMKQMERDLTMFRLPFDDSMWFILILADSPQTDISCDAIRGQLSPSEDEAVELMQDTAHSLVVILAEKERAAGLLARANALRDALRQSLPPDARIYGIPPQKGLRAVSRMYREARSLTEQELKNLPRACYPIDLEIQLIGQLRLGSNETAQRIVRTLQEKNEARGLSPEEVQSGARSVLNTMLRVAEDMQIDVGDAEAEFSKGLLRTDDFQWTWDYLSSLVYLICSQVNDPARQDAREIGRKMIEYVQAHYCESSLSQQELADLFQISRSAVSKIFKNAAKINFIDYLHLIRVQKAKEYFEAGSANILEVALKTGYENEVTFKRAFQRVESMTPKKYVDAVQSGRLHE